MPECININRRITACGTPEVCGIPFWLLLLIRPACPHGQTNTWLLLRLESMSELPSIRAHSGHQAQLRTH